MENYVKIFKALSDRTRVRIMRLLLGCGRELCICEITDSLALEQYKISKHIKELRVAGLLKERKCGRYVLYSLVKNEDDFRRSLFGAVRCVGGRVTREDAKRLAKSMKSRRKDPHFACAVNR